jgi:hypothetical protein
MMSSCETEAGSAEEQPVEGSQDERRTPPDHTDTADFIHKNFSVPNA